MTSQTKQTYNYLPPQNPKAGRFDILPKIHKPGNPGRTAHGLSQWTSWLKEYQSLLATIPWYSCYRPTLKTRPIFSTYLRKSTSSPPMLYSSPSVVSSLYTNIPTNEGIDVSRIALSQRTDRSVRSYRIHLWSGIRMIVLNREQFVDMQSWTFYTTTWYSYRHTNYSSHVR